jgi:L-asparagine transporter-like permease
LFFIWLIVFATGGINSVIAVICLCGALIMLSFYDQVDMKLRKSSKKTYATLTACYFTLALALGLFGLEIVSPEARGVLYITALAFAIILIYCWIADFKRRQQGMHAV